MIEEESHVRDHSIKLVLFPNGNNKNNSCHLLGVCARPLSSTLIHNPVQERATFELPLFAKEKMGSPRVTSPSCEHIVSSGGLGRTQCRNRDAGNKALCVTGFQRYIPAHSLCAVYRLVGTDEKQSFEADGADWGLRVLSGHPGEVSGWLVTPGDRCSQPGNPASSSPGPL